MKWFSARSRCFRPASVRAHSARSSVRGIVITSYSIHYTKLYDAVISHVGIYDSLRVELSPNGAFNIPEFGTVQDPDQFRALFAYSPYHHVTRAAYPPILFMTGENDGRVV